MKTILAAFLCLLLCASMSLAQNVERRRAAMQTRAASRAVSRLVAHGGGVLLELDFDRQEIPDALADWLRKHQAAIFGAGPSPFEKPAKWGVATTNTNRLFLHVMKWPEQGRLSVPRLHNSVKSVHVVGQTSELQLKPGIADWEITLPEQPGRRESILPVVELELDAPAVLGGTTPPTVTAERGLITLHARYAVVHGEMLRFEPQPHKNTIGYWVNENDWAEWKCQVTKSSKYEVGLRYGCGNGQGGSEIEVTVGEHILPFHVEATGGFQSWRDVELGTVELSAGKPFGVKVRPQKKAKNAVMDIQQITLRPID